MGYDLNDFTLDSGELDHKSVVDALQGLSDRLGTHEIKIINLCMEMRRVINKQRDMLDKYDRVYGPITNTAMIKEIKEGDLRKDSIRDWIEDVGLRISDSKGIYARDLHLDYCKHVGNKDTSITAFNKVLCELGYEKIRRCDGMVFMVRYRE